MSLQSLKDELERLSKLKDNWYSVAVAFEKYKEHCAGQAHLPRRMREACAACGYSLNTLARMIAVRSFFDSAKNQVKGLNTIDPNNLSFPSLEVVKRLHQVNPEAGIIMFSEVANGRITYRKLREHYNQVIQNNKSRASVQQISKRHIRKYKDAAFDAIISSTRVLFGNDENLIINKFSRIPPFSVDAIAFTAGTDLNAANFGFHFFFFLGNENPIRRLELLLSDLIFKSYFFSGIWVIFPSTLGEIRIKAFSETLDLLDRNNIGIAILHWGDDKDTDKNFPLKILRRLTRLPTLEWRGNQRSYAEIYFRLQYPYGDSVFSTF